ncbi:pollen Ole e I family allergen protein [Tasmannia lanceolata]|uniref:pollen Ole e I family allergen protein n=1 Tax=Tasmannia lanceolata TaxID=3420 RepID=UPI004063C124
MGRFPSFWTLIFLIILVGFGCGDGEEMTRPGFLYTRTRGRCTPQFWGSRREAWPRMVPQRSSVAKIFGSQALERYKSELTLVEATERNNEGNDPFSDLLKQSTAALLNSYARKGFPYTAWEVKTLLIQALVSEEAAALQASHFSLANHVCS